ncbi:MAG: sensor histidine kinase [Chthoniobacterales bacterium]
MNRFAGKGLTIGFVMTVAVLLGSGWLSYTNLRRLSLNEQLVVHTHEVLDEIGGVFSSLADAETGQRGYLLTGETGYLEKYQAAAAGARSHLEQIHALTSDNRAQQERVEILRPILDARLNSLRAGIQLYETGGLEPARAYVAQGKGKREMEKLRASLSQVERTERQLLHAREGQSRASYRTAVVTQWLTALVGLALVGTGFVLAAREVTTRNRGAEALERVNAELEMRVEERTADLKSAVESLRRSNRELEQFASVASHDLQEPLRKIQAFGDRLGTRSADELGEQGRDYLARMLSSAGRMRSLIDALLSFSRITTKAQPFIPVDLNATAEDVVSDLDALLTRSGGRVELGTLPTLEADPLQMRQLIQNLIGNGLKFSRPEVPPLVKIESRLLENGAEPNEEAVPRYEIAVSDNGIGFEEVYLDRIFELFQRLHGRQEYEGTGMGLAIVRKIVERHGGSITAKSAPGEGATFLVTLPLRQT